MKLDAGRLQLLTVMAILVLISGGIVAYAQNQYVSGSGSQAANGVSPNRGSSGSDAPVEFEDEVTSTTFTTTTTSTTSTSTSTTPAQICTPPTQPGEPGKLVLPITPTNRPTQGAINFAFGRGCLASITTFGGVFNVEVTLRFAKPITQYHVVLIANGTNYPLGEMVTGPGGSGQMQNQVLLKTGTYIVSLQIFDVSTTPGTSTLVLQTGQGTILSPPFPTSSGGGTKSSDDSDGDQSGQSGHNGSGD